MNQSRLDDPAVFVRLVVAVVGIGIILLVTGGFLTIARLRSEVPPRCQMRHYALCKLPHGEGYVVDCDDQRIHCDDEDS